jgi:hypothetical protein
MSEEAPPFAGHLALASAFILQRTNEMDEMSVEAVQDTQVLSVPECIQRLDGNDELTRETEVLLWGVLLNEAYRADSQDTFEFPNAEVTLTQAEVYLYTVYYLESIPDQQTLYDKLSRNLAFFNIFSHVSADGRVIRDVEVYKEIDWATQFEKGPPPTPEELWVVFPRIVQRLCEANEWEIVLVLAALALRNEERVAAGLPPGTTTPTTEVQGHYWCALSNAMNALQTPSFVHDGQEITAGDCYLRHIALAGPDVKVLSQVPHTYPRPTGVELAWRLALFATIVGAINIAAKRYLSK